jgi:hypothetical protein
MGTNKRRIESVFLGVLRALGEEKEIFFVASPFFLPLVGDSKDGKTSQTELRRT